jgi:hypothetical protein
MKKSNLVSIGLRAKTARAIAVVLGGPSEDPIVLRKFEMPLADPKIAATAQPYHEVMELEWAESQKEVRKTARAIEAIARKSLARLIKELQSEGMTVSGVGIVGAKDKDLARIGNFHIRAHAAEGVLFRQVLDLAADANRVKRRSFSDREFDELTAPELGTGIKQKLNNLGRSLPAPWRTDEKQAATAAWLVLHGRRK